MPVTKAGTIVLGATVPMTVAAFLIGQIRVLAEAGWHVHVVTSPGAELDGVRRQLEGVSQVKVHEIPMSREPSVWADLRSLRAWTRLLRELEPDVVMVGTPKAGLLGMLAARRARVPRRVYLLRGLRIEGLTGARRKVGIVAERAACRASTSIVCVSPSLLEEAVTRRLATPDKTIVLGAGSSHGVDTERFRPASPDERMHARERFGLMPQSLVIGYAGRLVSDKGISDLLEAMAVVVAQYPEARLLIAGGTDRTDPLPRAVEGLLASPWVVAVGPREDMPDFYRALDVFCLPSLREGFPNVNLEASATAVAVVTTTATGCRDSVIPGITGLIVAPGDAAGLAEALCQELHDPDLRARHGAAGRARVVAEFESSVVWQAVLTYLEQITAPGTSEPGR